jgi:putative membrane protein
MNNLMILTIALVAPALASAADKLTDAQIAAIVVTANQIDIDACRLAESKSTNPEVKAFAHRMIADHTNVNKQATDLATRLKITPEESTLSRAMKSDAKRHMDEMEKLNSEDFDKLYLNDEFSFHNEVIDAVDSKLMPSAENIDLKSLLAKVRPALIAHRDHADKLLSIVHQMNYK